MGGACFSSLSPLIFISFSDGQIGVGLSLLWQRHWVAPVGARTLPVPDAVPACAGQQGHTAQIISPLCEIGPKGSFPTSENILRLDLGGVLGG